jgi:uncharacterized protein (TIGR00369 family)
MSDEKPPPRTLFWEMVEGQAPKAPSSAMLGSTFVSFDRERSAVRLTYEVKPEFLNVFRTVQGGFLSAMLDDAMGHVGAAVLDNQIGQTLELKTSFFRAVRSERLSCEARVVHRGGSILFLEATISDAQGGVVATATATARIVDLVSSRSAPPESGRDDTR